MSLTTPVLVLNRVWYPINLVSAKRAICMLFEGDATAVDDDFTTHDFSSWVGNVLPGDDPEYYIKTPRMLIRVPEVLVLANYDRVPKTRAKLSRANIYRRDGSRCMYCGGQFRRSELTIDHVVPRARGGTTTWTNCVAACLPCNSEKADAPPEKYRAKLKRQPFEPDGRHMASMMVQSRMRPAWKKFIN